MVDDAITALEHGGTSIELIDAVSELEEFRIQPTVVNRPVRLAAGFGGKVFERFL
ncbi:MAG: hypothetical protein ABEH90_05630 [Halolamina sp.]